MGTGQQWIQNKTFGWVLVNYKRHTELYGSYQRQLWIVQASIGLIHLDGIQWMNYGGFLQKKPMDTTATVLKHCNITNNGTKQYVTSFTFHYSGWLTSDKLQHRLSESETHLTMC